MRETLPKDELAEVTVSGDEDTMLTASKGQNLLIGEAAWILARDCSYIVVLADQMGNQAKVGALVKEEPHTGGGTLTSAASRRGRFSRTNSLA